MGSKKIILVGMVLILFVGAVMIYANTLPGKQDEFAKCLSSKDAKMYGAYWCSHCQNQKKEFGNSWKYIEYVECDASGQNGKPQECSAAGVTGYPTWIINGQKYEGERSLSELSSLTGCPLAP